MPVLDVTKFERFFRAAAELDVDRADMKRYEEFLSRKVADLMVRAQAAANANGRDVIEPQDLPITKGLRQRMYEFAKLDEEIGLKSAIDQLTPLPPIDYEYSDEARAELPDVMGGLSVALAKSFALIDPNVKNPQTWQWEKAFQLFDLMY